MVTGAEGTPTRPIAFGEELRRLRDNAGLSLDDIIAETKISRRILEALEAGKFQFLPEKVFCTNFVRQYARIIVFDESRLLEWFDAAWEHFLVASGTHQSLLLEDHEPPPKPAIRWRFWIPIALGVVIVIVVAVLIMRGPGRGDELSPDPRRSSALVPERPGTSTRIPSPTVPAPEQGSVAPVQEREQGLIDLVVQVANEKECWIHYRDREGRTDQHLLANGRELTLELRGPVLLTLGNAGAATLRIGETIYRDLGSPGQVIHMELSEEGLAFLGAGVHDE